MARRTYTARRARRRNAAPGPGRKKIGEYMGVDIYVAPGGHSISAPSLNLFGYAYERNLKRDIKKELRKREQKRKPNPRKRRTRNFASGWRGIRNLPNNYPLTTGSSNAWARNPAAVRKAAGIYGKRWVVEDFAGIRRLYVHKTNVRTYVLTETERLSLDDMVAINGQYHFSTLKDLKAALVKAERGRTSNRRKNPTSQDRRDRAAQELWDSLTRADRAAILREMGMRSEQVKSAAAKRYSGQSADVRQRLRLSM